MRAKASPEGAVAGSVKPPAEGAPTPSRKAASEQELCLFFLRGPSSYDDLLPWKHSSTVPSTNKKKEHRETWSIVGFAG